MNQFIPAMQSAGFRTDTVPFFSDHYLKRQFTTGRKPLYDVPVSYIRRLKEVATADHDAIWIEKEGFPFLPSFAEGLIRKRNIPYVLDFDDAIFHNYDRHPSRLVRAALGDKLQRLIRESAAVFAGNDYLADYARAAGARNVLLVPTVVDPDRYPVHPSNDDGTIRIGWIGTPANARYLEPCIEAINALADKHRLQLTTIGAAPVLGLRAPQENLPWSLENEGTSLSRIDIGVMPLTDTPWERGKCGYKLIQYMAAGKPVIASPVGVNTSIATPEVGLLAASVDEWISAIDRLAGDRKMRQRMGAAARRKVEEDYSIAAVAPTIVDTFHAITGQRFPA